MIEMIAAPKSIIRFPVNEDSIVICIREATECDAILDMIKMIATLNLIIPSIYK
jgi:hypothetical protein